MDQILCGRGNRSIKTTKQEHLLWIPRLEKINKGTQLLFPLNPFHSRLFLGFCVTGKGRSTSRQSARQEREFKLNTLIFKSDLYCLFRAVEIHKNLIFGFVKIHGNLIFEVLSEPWWWWENTKELCESSEGFGSAGCRWEFLGTWRENQLYFNICLLERHLYSSQLFSLLWQFNISTACSNLSLRSQL